MMVLATGVVDGPEARGKARILESEDGQRHVELTELWVAPGAPDVRLYASPHPDGRIDGAATDLGSVPYDTPDLKRPLPHDVTLPAALVIYCGVYSVHFGHATLEWHEPSVT